MQTAGQTFQRTADLLRETGHGRAELVMGPFPVPLSVEHREAIDRFMREAIDRALPVVHLRGDREESVTVVVTQGRA